MERFWVFLIVLALGACAFFFLAIDTPRPTQVVLKNPTASEARGAKVFRIPINENPPSLDPAKIDDVLSDGIGRKMFNMLVRSGPDLLPTADLAESVPAWNSADHSYTFKLRPGVKFHNGREVVAEDVKYSFNRLLNPKVSVRTQNVERIVGGKDVIEGRAVTAKGIEILDKYTIKLTLVGPSPTFLHEISTVNAAIIPREAVESAEKEGSSFSRQPVGTGPFSFVSWKENSRIEFKRFDDYFKGTPRLEGVVYEIIPDPQARLDRFAKGDFEVCDIPFGKYKPLKEEHPEWISENPTYRTLYLGLTIQKADAQGNNIPAGEIGKNLKLRQAINYALNRKYICEVVLEGRAQPANSILPPGMLAHDSNLRGWEYNPDKAKALLAEAGFPEGKGLPTFTLQLKNDADPKRVGAAIQQDLANIGVNIELQALDWATFLDKVRKDPTDMYTLSWIADYNDPDNFLFFLFHTGNIGSTNATRYTNAQVDQWLNEARATVETSKREELYRQAEKQIVADLPWALLYQPRNVILIKPNVKNVRGKLTPLDVGTGFNQLEFADIDM